MKTFRSRINAMKQEQNKIKMAMRQVRIPLDEEYESFKQQLENYFSINYKYDGIVGIDPGFNTSVCSINVDYITIVQISAPQRKPFFEKMLYLHNSIEYAFQMIEFNRDTDIIYLEDVEVWGSIGAQGKSNIGKASLKSEVSSARGDLLKLARVIGMYCEYCFENYYDVELIPALHWKGQLSKKATERWICDSLPALENSKEIKLTEHMWDSLGICLSKIYDWKHK